ncbi:hypothetical protein EJD97_001337 [Solanum chilense]|uniref:Uncharacterized protein n=1 Tax=Solanum chilense TaxID=4083 RepID=A0A6N2BZU6_SOLCI|nr:hypothetical protein EJD97_001337 [Solanum chilense]
MKTWKNCDAIAEVMTYGAIDGPLTPRRFVGGHRRIKEMLIKEDRGISTMCGAMEALDEPSPPRRTVLHIRHC